MAISGFYEHAMALLDQNFKHIESEEVKSKALGLCKWLKEKKYFTPAQKRLFHVIEKDLIDNASKWSEPEAQCKNCGEWMTFYSSDVDGKELEMRWFECERCGIVDIKTPTCMKEVLDRIKAEKENQLR